MYTGGAAAFYDAIVLVHLLYGKKISFRLNSDSKKVFIFGRNVKDLVHRLKVCKGKLYLGCLIGDCDCS